MSNRRAAASLALLITLAAGGPLAAQSPTSAPASSLPRASATTRLRSADLLADVAILRRAYDTLHPGLTRYNTPAQIDAAFGALESEFRQDRTLADAYLAFSVLAARIKCGHTYANFFNQSSAVQAALFRGPRLPFHFRWLGSRMIVTRSFASEPGIRAGSEVLALNGVSVADILARLMTVARADGNNDAKRLAYLGLDGTSRYEAFDIYWPLFFPSTSPVVTLRVRDADASGTRTFQVPLVTDAARLAALAASGKTDAAPDAPLWELRLLDDRVGVSPGVKFKDAELLGVPWVLVIGRGWAEGTVELRNRFTGEAENVPAAEAVATVVARVRG